ncbi:MAG: class I mannose-6-phosphate isomerase [Defluviitaleaceae bacterium]|nr:class I mannose-6-phosphate isomerase [Defluviitaleaceae bacterium]
MKTEKNIIKLNSERVWRTYLGGAELDRWHGTENPKDGEYPEEWFASVTMSVNTAGESVAEGLATLADAHSTTLKALIDSDPQHYLGAEHVHKYGSSLGFLTKAIDSLTRLGIQVHPSRSDAMALLNSPYGKTESWYIVGRRMVDGEKPHVFLGFKEGVTKERLKELFDKQDTCGMLDCLHRIEVEPGDMYIINGGVPHAIGKGCFLIELQEPTDYTFRLEKTAPSGVELAEEFMSHGLGFEKMFECFSYETYSREEVLNMWKVKPKVSNVDGTEHITLLGRDTTDLFGMSLINAAKPCKISLNNTFAVAIMLEGEGWLCKEQERVMLRQGETAFLPAYANDIELEPSHCPSAKLILCFPPKS